MTKELIARRIALGRKLGELAHQIETGTIVPYIAMAELESLTGKIEICLAELDATMSEGELKAQAAPFMRKCTCQLSYGPAESIPDDLHDDDCERREDVCPA